MEIIDLYYTEKLLKNKYKIIGISQLKKFKRLKKKEEFIRQIYVFKDINLIKEKGKSICYKFLDIKSEFIDNLLINYLEIKKLPIQCFPFINKYDDIITQKITVYFLPNNTQNYIQLISEKNEFGDIHFIRTSVSNYNDVLKFLGILDN